MLMSIVGLILCCFLLLFNNAVVGLLIGFILDIILSILGISSLKSLLLIGITTIGVQGIYSPEVCIGIILGFFCASPVSNSYRNINTSRDLNYDYVDVSKLDNSIQSSLVEAQTDCLYSGVILSIGTLIFFSGSNIFFTENSEYIKVGLYSISAIVALITWILYFIKVVPDKVKPLWLIGFVLAMIFTILMTLNLASTRFNNLLVMLPLILFNLPLKTLFQFQQKKNIDFKKGIGGVQTNPLSNATLASLLSGLLILNSNSMLISLFTKQDKENIQSYKKDYGIEKYPKKVLAFDISIAKAINYNLQFFSWIVFGSGRLGETSSINMISMNWELPTLTISFLLFMCIIIKSIFVANNLNQLLEFIHKYSINSLFSNLITLFFSFTLLFLIMLAYFPINISIICLSLLLGILVLKDICKSFSSFTLVPLLVPALFYFV